MSKRGTEGTYVQIYKKLFHDRDYRRLSSSARLVLLSLMATTNVAGFQKHYVEEIVETTGLKASVQEALAELESYTDEGGRPHPWIRRDGSLIWVRNYLRFRPYARLSSPSIKAAVERILADYGQSALVAEFREYYKL